MKVNMNLAVSSAILSAVLLAIPEPSSVPANELGELILEERSSQPIVSLAFWPPDIHRRDPVLLKRTGETTDTKGWWVDRARGVHSQRQIALADPSGDCPSKGYVKISGYRSIDLDRAGWGLARYRAFLKGNEEINYRCVAEDQPFLEVCSNVEGLREGLGQKTPTYLWGNDQRVWLRIDSTSDAEISLASPYRLTVKLHRPVPF